MSAGLAALALLCAAAATGVLYHQQRVRRQVSDRLADIIDVDIDREGDGDGEHEQLAMPPFPPRYRSAPPLVGGLTAIILWLAAGLPLEVSTASGCLVGVLGYLIEEHVAERRVAAIQAQLSDAIDLLVASLRAGSALLAAFESSSREMRAPLGPYLDEIVGRIRLGDDPRQVIADLPDRVPLETFRLFAVSLSVHWDVGGSLASTLATVGRTIRDRIEMARRVQAQAVEANVSVASVISIAYLLAVLMWRTDPERMEAFVRTGVGSELVAGVIGLQAVGLLWMSRISRSGF